VQLPQVCSGDRGAALPADGGREIFVRVIPAVVGTSNATDRIKTGDRVRVNGTTGVVDILT